ncbi:hypothetical protein M527_08400 [Sphingobium indicum IP26]|uniref:Uncharacterized protein n=1 Tax=Sphingobium indicum F2 TaxID=1450518 RepID=A0A8E0WN72_9SPHN|nr:MULTISPECIES: hypothetical protein [Sphingobium]EPR09056.1 hypothetical protein M527_08400 [Sphingobium indicum IP26]EQB06954.1 hypothetical protein L286_04935 [Sphingobium sp. HDIP04]KER34332.1 hypothetical protein AL00_21865 [Sphingobium indicum F2]
MEQRTLLERLARHLASGHPDPHPDRWQEQVEAAAGLLAIIKDPDDVMRQAGDDRIWRAMIDAALRQRWSIASAPSVEPPGGADEEGDIPLTPDTVSGNRAEWVHLHETQEKPK